MTLKLRHSLAVFFFISCLLLPVQAAVRSPDEPDVERQSNSPFLTLTHLELSHSFWSKFLDSGSTDGLLERFYSDGKVNTFLSNTGADCLQPASECERVREVMKSGFMHITTDIVPEEFWEEQLVRFYTRVLTLDEAQSYVVTYERLAGTSAEGKLGQARASFFQEVLPDLVPQIRNMAQAFRVPIGGMAPSLLAGDYFIVNKLAYQDQTPRYGDVVVFKYPEDESFIFVKRIVGSPGDKVEIRDKIVYVNGQVSHEGYQIQHTDARTIEKAINPRDNMDPVTVPENSYFVLGDNRDQSLDSRFWGFVKRDRIIGKASIIYWSWDERARTARWERAGQRIH